MGLNISTASLARAISQSKTESFVAAIAGSVTSGATKLGAGDSDHAGDAALTACWQAGNVLGGSRGDKGRNSEDELHFG